MGLHYPARANQNDQRPGTWKKWVRWCRHWSCWTLHLWSRSKYYKVYFCSKYIFGKHWPLPCLTCSIGPAKTFFFLSFVWSVEKLESFHWYSGLHGNDFFSYPVLLTPYYQFYKISTLQQQDRQKNTFFSRLGEGITLVIFVLLSLWILFPCYYNISSRTWRKWTSLYGSPGWY